ncbi:MAG: aminoacyl--tRNA ligase-related protein, partial [Bacillota bacterium]
MNKDTEKQDQIVLDFVTIFAERPTMSDITLSQWYSTIIQEAKIADYGPVHGSLVIRPYGFAIWNQLRDVLDQKLGASGHQQAYFPLLIPEKFIRDQSNYIENFAPRVLTVTKVSDRELAEPLVLRPTSETIVTHMFSKWIDSYRDLPLKLYQWSNIARWEERTRPLIKNVEILWLEGHTAHTTHQEALEEVIAITNLFKTFLTETLSIPVYSGIEPDGRRFAGSLDTYTVEALMPDGKVLQLAAAYDLGQKFSRAFRATFRDSDNLNHHCWTTNWGLGFRLIAASMLVHGDSDGLRLPPEIAPVQVLI